jgi:type I thyroxine 5'-deiodinase
MESNVRQNVVFASPKNIAERTEIAGACMRNLHLQIPALLDGLDNPIERAYTGWPDRLYVIDRDGKVAFKSKPGPFGFHPADMERALRGVLNGPLTLVAEPGPR